MRYILSVVICFTVVQVQSAKLPQWFLDAFKAKGLDKKYVLTPYLKNDFLQADFNGDTAIDVAALIVEKGSERDGILLIHKKTNEHFIFGAGVSTLNGYDDYNWMLKWSLYKKDKTFETIYDKNTGEVLSEIELKLKHPALLLEGYETKEKPVNGVVYWNGSVYIWVPQAE